MEYSENKFINQLMEIVTQQYLIKNLRGKFISHGESAVYQVTSQDEKGAKYLLRIHNPKVKVRSDNWYAQEVINSELCWLRTINEETDLCVNEPVATSEGEYSFWYRWRQGRQSVCTLLKWMDGDKLPERTPELVYEMGKLIGRLHKFASQWEISENFVRPKYDIVRFTAALESLKPYVGKGVVSTSDIQSLENVLNIVLTTADQLGQSRKFYGLIHADLHQDNILYYKNKLIPIDFAGCGFGYYLFDLAWSIFYIPQTLRMSFIRGYESVYLLPEDYLHLMEGFYLLALIDTIPVWMSNEGDRKSMSTFIPKLVQKECKAYQNNRRFLQI